jgi:hypothetical protein
MGLPKGDYIAGKRRAHLALVCMLLRVYFRLNNIQGCTQVARTITNIYGARNSTAIDLRVRHRRRGNGGSPRWRPSQAGAGAGARPAPKANPSPSPPTPLNPRTSPRSTASPSFTSSAAPSCTTKTWSSRRRG